MHMCIFVVHLFALVEQRQRLVLATLTEAIVEIE